MDQELSIYCLNQPACQHLHSVFLEKKTSVLTSKMACFKTHCMIENIGNQILTYKTT